VEVVQATLNSANTVFALGTDSNNWYRFVIEDGQLYFQQKINGVKSSASIAYDGLQQRHWRLRHDQGSDQIVFETSGDGTVWTARRSVARQLAITALRVELDAGTWGAVTTAGKAIFDNFILVSNSAPPANQPPVANPGGPYNAVAGQAVQFNGGGSSDADGTITGYRWDFGDNTTGTGISPTHTYTAAGTYAVTLIVTDNSGATGSASTTATITAPVTPPAAPTNLTASSLSKGQITLSWTDNSTNEQLFRIERSLSASSGFAEIATVGVDVKTYTNKGLTSNQLYYYRVRASNSAGSSAYSNVASVRAK
jgi:PKD repeat protein